ncbi:MAG: vWA domain-containing protein [Candidatus Gastranaerophilaceae bacterium]|nr:von Willebrand factor type A domain protein [Clostridium sp. CAG:967]
MKKILLILFLFSMPVFAGNYGVYTPDTYSADDVQEDERILFILDFSNSMSEYLDGRRKVDLMIDTMKSLLPNMNKNISVGLRVYGHRMGLTPFEACRASTLVSPIAVANGINIRNSLLDIKPRGMTPITYSLKQAVKNDFLGFTGKKHIILLTDGGENCDESPCSYVLELIKVRKDVKIDVIAFNIDDEDDLSQLECTSLVTSGKFYNANTAAELARSLNSSVNSVKTVEARIIENP